MKYIKLEVTGDYKGNVYQCIEGGAVVEYRDEAGIALDFADLTVELTIAERKPAKPGGAE